ncbi:MAG: class I SAM-dependent methyltransferase, partial [Pseudomonadota bacterium]
MTATDWYDDDRFWALFGDCMFHPETFARAAEELPAIIALAGIPVARVLDLGCGPGRHAVPFAEAGLAVTGVDLSRTLLDQGRARAAAAGVELEWIEGDMRRFDRPGGFELILSL